jgi:tocopherol O-methyltransferase
MHASPLVAALRGPRGPGLSLEAPARAPQATRTPESRRRAVRAYYDETQVLYSRIWSPTGVHYGFWEHGTRTRQQAIRNMDRQVARELGLPMGSRVLDAGCGIGGTSIFLAEELHHRVTGITLSPAQLRRALRASQRCRAPVRPRFLLRDYLATGLASHSFDGIFGIESVCYAQPKVAFCREAFRLLRRGGRVVVLDGFLTRTPERDEIADYRAFCDGLAIDNLDSVDGFTAALAEAGFEEISCTDRRAMILPSARSIHRLSRLGVAVCRIPCALGIWPMSWIGHGLAGLSQRRLFGSGLVTYCVFSATRP